MDPCRHAALAAGVFMALGACKETVQVQGDLTGVELTLRYDPALGIDQIEVSGTLEAGGEAFVPGLVPKERRTLTEGENTLVILLPEETVGTRLTISARGMRDGRLAAVGQTEVSPESGRLIAAMIRLDVPDVCGDGTVGAKEGCDDGDTEPGDGCAADCTPEPGYTCSGEPSACSCAGDVDGDGLQDCTDACLDGDRDGYGLPGGATTSTCAGLDCDDTAPGCTTDCATDLDQDGTPDCKDLCVDPDGDGYGTGTGCIGPDCDEGSPGCNVDCAADADGDGTLDCDDPCVDPDEDGYGVGAGCMGPDCDEGSPGCNVDCAADADGDGTLDCDDPCVDPDGDGYGAGTGCMGSDCDETSPTCNVDCVADEDSDGTVDCDDTCIDGDSDGYGAGAGCAGADCDDGAPTCTTDCTVDADGDAVPDCGDGCLDADGDGYGMPGSAAASTCLGGDCDDLRAACTVDCVACLPGALTLTVQSPVSACTSSALTIDLDGYDGAAADLTCTAAGTEILPAASFEGDFGPWSDTNNVSLESWPDQFPTPSCSNGGGFARFSNFATGTMQLAAPLDTTGFENLMITFRTGYRGVNFAGDDVEIQGCCGAGCTPDTFGTAENNGSGGTDDCTDHAFALPAYANGCPSLMLRFVYPWGTGYAGVDDVALVGDVTFDVLLDRGGGTYTSELTLCEPTTASIECTWDDGTNAPLSDTDTLDVQ